MCWRKKHKYNRIFYVGVGESEVLDGYELNEENSEQQEMWWSAGKHSQEDIEMRGTRNLRNDIIYNFRFVLVYILVQKEVKLRAFLFWSPPYPSHILLHPSSPPTPPIILQVTHPGESDHRTRFIVLWQLQYFCTKPVAN